MTDLPNLPQMLRDAARPVARELSTLDCVRLHYTEGRRLTPSQEETRLRLETAHSMLLNHETRSVIVPFLESRFNIRTTQAYKVVADAEQLFGEISKHTREGARYLLVEQLRKKAKYLDEHDEHELYLKCQDMIAKLTGSYDHAPKHNSTKILLPKTIIFTTDPVALEMQRQIEATEEADYDEVS